MTQKSAISLQNPANLSSVGNKISAKSIAIIGGGIASAALCLSLAERGQNISLFCKDSGLAKGASGNRQAVLYPLLTPEHCALSQFYLQSYLFCRKLIQQLIMDGYNIAHDFCGVLQTAHNDKTAKRLQKIMTYPWSKDLVQTVIASKSNELAGLSLEQGGLYYPQGSWIDPRQLTQAIFDKAVHIGKIETTFSTCIPSIEQRHSMWYLNAYSNNHSSKVYGPFNQLILANGCNITDFEQTQYLPLTPFRGQVSYISQTQVTEKLKAVLCSEGYLTPAYQGIHCLGASYIKGSKQSGYSNKEQQDNKDRIVRSFPDADWVHDLDISDKKARAAVRMVSRDHFPMMGAVPDIEALSKLVKQHPQDAAFWQQQKIPAHQELFILGGLGSRGICTAPLTAEALACQICAESSPFTNKKIIENLNPNRFWLRKLLKGRRINFPHKPG